jgi:DeoR/GlpR family transcriptional regulator of sugar metabolism
MSIAEEPAASQKRAKRRESGRAKARRTRIVELAQLNGAVRSSELSAFFNVSVVTIRQDLSVLVKRGLLARTYGGAVALEAQKKDTAFQYRQAQHAEQKQQIGALAASLIQAGETVLLDAGTTTIEIARRIPENSDVTVVTCAVNVALEAIQRQGVNVILCGGILNPRTLAVAGHHVERVLEELHADKLFLATYALNLEKGLCERNFQGASLKRALINAAREVVVVCDSSKFNCMAPVVTAQLATVNRVITDSGISDADYEKLLHRGVAVDRAGTVEV